MDGLEKHPHTRNIYRGREKKNTQERNNKSNIRGCTRVTSICHH
jgi:hypothetical protein